MATQTIRSAAERFFHLRFGNSPLFNALATFLGKIRPLRNEYKRSTETKIAINKQIHSSNLLKFFFQLKLKDNTEEIFNEGN